jgi:hypothetical protein
VCGGGRNIRKEYEDEYGGNIIYSCMKVEKMRPVETIPGVGREER